MAGKHRAVPRPPSRKRKASVRPVPPRPKGEEERTAVRRLAAMKYRLAGATDRVIAEKLTEERAQAFAVEKGISFERAMTQARLEQDRLGRRDGRDGRICAGRLRCSVAT